MSEVSIATSADVAAEDRPAAFVFSQNNRQPIAGNVSILHTGAGGGSRGAGGQDRGEEVMECSLRGEGEGGVVSRQAAS